MIELTTITIAASAVVLCLALVAVLMNPFLRVPMKRKDQEDVEHEELPPLSVIIRVGDDVDMLEKNIKLFMEQHYAPGFQLIIVANEGDSRADDLAKLYADKANIKSTFIPSTSRYLSRGKLGVTLGVKAADNEWCILTNASCYPESELWLEAMGRRCSKDKNIVIGYSNYDDEAKGFQRFSRMRQFAISWLDSLDTAYSANSRNIAFRKSDFIGNDGYRGNLDSIHSEYDFLVNKLALRNKTAVVADDNGRMTERAPSNKEWHRERMYSIDASSNMARHFSHIIMPLLDNIMLNLAWIASVAAIAYAVVTNDWIMLGTAIMALLILIVGRTIIDARASKFFKASIPAWKVFITELTSPWHTLSDKLRYRFANKKDFTSHKL